MATTAVRLQTVRIPNDEQDREITAVLSRCWHSFCRTASRHLDNVADAEDAVQDALLSAYKHLDQFRGQARMSTWLTAIVVNSARMQLRKRLRYVHVALDEEDREYGNYPILEQLSASGPSPEEACRKSELAKQIVQLAQRLSPPLRKVFRLRELDGLSIRETADILGVAEGTVKARLARARSKLRDQMRKKLHGKQSGARLRSDPRMVVRTPYRTSS